MASDFDSTVDYYEILGLTPPVTSAAVQAAFTRAMDKWQSDGGRPEHRARLEQARQVLSDILLRASYDKAREKLRKLVTQRSSELDSGRGVPVAGPAAAPAVAPSAKAPVAAPSVTRYEPASAAGIEDAETRVRNFPDDLDAMSWLAFQYYSAGDYPKAIETYQRYLVGRDDDPEAHYYLARAFQRSDRTAEMRAAAQRVIDLEPAGERAAKCASMLKK